MGFNFTILNPVDIFFYFFYEFINLNYGFITLVVFTQLFLIKRFMYINKILRFSIILIILIGTNTFSDLYMSYAKKELHLVYYYLTYNLFISLIISYLLDFDEVKDDLISIFMILGKVIKKIFASKPKKQVLNQKKHTQKTNTAKQSIYNPQKKQPTYRMIQKPDVPKLNDIVYINKRKYPIKRYVGKGKEAECFLTSNITVIKLFNSKSDLEQKYKKINKLIKLNSKNKNICFPKHFVFNDKKEFVGYSMNKAFGVELKDCLFTIGGQKKHFPRWTTQDINKLCLALIHAVNDVHEYNIIIGDLNASNIIIKNSEELYLIDSDSYQIDKLLCTVGVPEYTRPKYINKKDYNYQKIKEDDNYAVTVLCFQILMGSQLPYTYKGGGTIQENINKGYFPYHKTDRTKCHDVPNDVYIKLWFQLCPELRHFFFDVFQLKKSYTLSSMIKVFKKNF